MIRTLLFTTVLATAPAALAQDHTAHHGHGAGQAGADPQADDRAADQPFAPVTLSRTPDIDAALAAGGTPVVVEVMGVVCDFCAMAMNKTFGRRDGVTAVYVDLDAKTLNLVLTSADGMDDEAIAEAVTQSGYKTKAIHRGDDIGGVRDASAPA